MVEADMVAAGVAFLEKQHQYKFIKREIPFLSRCIDVVAMSQTGEIISIEFKISKWRHAIEQASNHKLGADKAYICLPDRRVTEALNRAVREAGIGLLLIKMKETLSIEEAIPAPDVSSNISVFRNMLLDNLRKIED